MSTTLFEPETWLKLHLPKAFRRKLLTRDLTLKRGLLQALIISSAVSKRDLKGVINDVIDKYEEKMQTLEDEGERKALSKAKNNEKLLRKRVENYLVYEESKAVREANVGKRYIWMPSSSEEPRPEHQLKYGKVFTFGSGDEEPNEAFGCKCGFLIID